MPSFPSLVPVLIGNDASMRRLVLYWAVTMMLYAVCLLLLAFSVEIGMVAARPAGYLGGTMLGGALLLYGPVRACHYLRLPLSILVISQSLFAIVCIIAAYALAGPVRGATLGLLLVVLVFGAFTLTPRQLHGMSVFTITLLALSMLWMSQRSPQIYKPQEELIHFALASSMLIAISFVSGQLSMLRQRLKKQKAELADALIRIQALATLDELTQLANRRYMNEVLAREEKRHSHLGGTLCLALLDIDWFKRVNDTYGHAAGDKVLRHFAQQAQATVRSSDILARWGGEEFLLLLPDTQLREAIDLLERMKAHTTATPLADIAPDLRITFSAGLIASRHGEAVTDMVRRADEAMYRAKEQGRDRIVSA